MTVVTADYFNNGSWREGNSGSIDAITIIDKLPLDTNSTRLPLTENDQDSYTGLAKIWDDFAVGVSSWSKCAQLKLKPTCELDQNAKNIIGDSGVGRFEQFTLLTRGWDGGEGEELSPYSVGAFLHFTRIYQELFEEVSPSIFITTNGNIQINWEDDSDNVVEIEFFLDYVEYYIEAHDLEDSLPLNNLGNLVDILKQ
jgi:hypothetical protein